MSDQSNQILDAALKYAARGWAVFPLAPGTKVPPYGSHGHKDATTDADAIRRLWTTMPNANIAIATGTRSGLFLFDVDRKNGKDGFVHLDKLEAQYGQLPKTRAVCTPSGGGHYFFSMPVGVELKSTALKIDGKEIGIDIKADSGYAVAPPSATPDGKYILAADEEIVPAPEWLLDFIVDAQKTTERTPAPATPSVQPTSDMGDSDRVRRARAYLDKIPGGVDGEHGSNPCLWAASVLVWGYCLDRGTARQLMGEYSARCSPPWSEKEIEHKLDDAAKGGIGKPQGWLLDAPRPERNGTPAPSASSGAVVATEPERPRFRIYSDSEFSKGDFRPNWLVKNVLTVGEPCGIGAAMKSLKTSIACDLALSLVTGTPFLNTFEVVRPVGTLFLSGESGRSTTQLLRSRVLDAKGLRDAEFDNMFWQFDTPQLDDLIGMGQLVEEYAKRGVEVAILDPLYLMFGDVDTRSIFEAGRALRNVSRLFSDKGITPILIHHASRALKPGEKMELHHLSHAGFAEFVRQFMLINRVSEYQYDGRHTLNVRIGGSCGHSGEYVVEVDEGMLNEDFTGRKWDVAVTPAADARQAKVDDREERKAEQGRQTILGRNAKLLDAIDKEVEKGEGGATKNAIETLYKLKGRELSETISRLRDDGQIEDCEWIKEIGSGAKRKVFGFRRPAKVEQSDIPFGDQPPPSPTIPLNDDDGDMVGWSGPTTDQPPRPTNPLASLYREAGVSGGGMVCDPPASNSTKTPSKKKTKSKRKPKAGAA